ncbi:MAG: hypothetical protein RIR17_661 [Planctomycetota bacterium]|jgi:hypothetical protein
MALGLLPTIAMLISFAASVLLIITYGAFLPDMAAIA